MAIIGTWSNSSGKFNWQTTVPSSGPYHIVALSFNGGTFTSANGTAYSDSLTTYLQYFDQDAYTGYYGPITLKLNGTVSKLQYIFNTLTVTGASASSITSTGFKASNFTNESGMGITWQWTYAGGGGGGGGEVTYSACSAPTSTSLSASTVDAGTKVTFSWSGASGGTNNAIVGYSLKITDETAGTATYPYINSTSSSGSYQVSTGGLGGHTLKVQVLTCGAAGKNYYSGYTTAKTITINTPQVQRTITCYSDENETSVVGTRTGYYGNKVTLPTPTARKGYLFKGWYTKHNSTKSKVINYGDKYTYSSSVSTSFSTYMSNYAIAATGSYGTQEATSTAIFSMTEGCGYSFEINKTGTQIGFYTQTKPGGFDSVVISTSEVSPGWHDWSCIFDGSEKKLYLYMDGRYMGSSSTTWSYINWVPDYGASPNDPMNLLVAAEYVPDASDQIGWYNFTGKVGNFFIDETEQLEEVSYTRTIMPDKNISMYPRYEKIVYIYSGNKWHTAKPYIFKNSTDKWIAADPWVFDGTTWR